MHQRFTSTLRALCLATAALTGVAALPARAQVNLSPASQAEIGRLLASQNSWTVLNLLQNRLPRVPADAFDRYMMWNEIALDTTAIDHTPLVPGDIRPTFGQQFGPHRASRAMAIVHIAMFEAVNALTHRFESYAGFPAVQGNAHAIDAAIAQSSHDALLALFPAQQARLDALLAQDLATMVVSPGRLAAGESLGAAAARTILALRANDGSARPEVNVGTGPGDYHVSGQPGTWSPDPVSQLTLTLGVHWGEVKPFVMRAGDQFRPNPPPALNSQAYAQAYAHTLTLGGDPAHGTPTVRTPEETFVGRFWAYDGTPALCAPPRLYNMVARAVALQQGMSDVAEAARYLALVNTAMGDAGISAWDSKWHYHLWRPVTAIRGADIATNPYTVPHAGWYPLGAPDTNTGGPNFTPPFPAYPSGHATFGGAVFEVMRSYWPDHTAFTIVSDEYNGLNRDVSGTVRPLVPQTFHSFSDAEYANAESRIYNGIHWEFDALTGIDEGNQVARYVMAHSFKRVGGS